MVALVALPLVGMFILALQSIGQTHGQVLASRRAKDAGVAVAQATEVAAAVAIEHYWAGATLAVEELGFDPAAMSEVLGVDVRDAWVRSQAEVDRLVPSLPVDGLQDTLTAARASGDPGVGGAYATAEELVASRVELLGAGLESAALSVVDSEAMVGAADNLTLSIQLREQVFVMIADLFGSRFPDQAVTADPRRGLVEARARYSDTMAALDAGAERDVAFTELLTSIGADQRNRAFIAEVDSEIDRIGAPSATAEPLDLATTSVAFTNSFGVLDRYGEAVAVAEDDLAETGEALASSADATRRNETVAAALVGLVTVGLVYFLSRWVVRSLDGISISATAMNDGDLDRPAPVKGPRQVRVAAQALNGAAANIRSAENQVLALAVGDVSEAAGFMPVPGRLGNSLHAAFDRLGSSMEDRERLRQELHQEANHDALTGLYNRAAIMRALTGAVDRVVYGSGQIALLFIDIDGFKAINDQFGHGVGDEVLQVIARRVRHAARANDLVGRLGGDELVLVADPIDGVDDVAALARRVIEAVDKPISGRVTLTPTISIGVAMGVAIDTTPGGLLHDADLAVYEAKAAGGNRIEICTPELREASTRRQAMEKALTAAIADGDLVVHFQAIVDALEPVVTGFEALVRWPRSDGTIRQPGDFVPLAERSSLIVELDRWVIGATVAQLATWSQDPGTASLTASVNISARHASAAPFADHVIGVLERSGVAPERLVVELTESALIANLDHVVSELARLQEHGVGVAVDDFGTGYTSLTLLQQLPIDSLKLDRVLTGGLTEERRRAVVKLIVDTAHIIGLSVTAEGVESGEQADQLRQLGVDRLQGFHFHRPCAPDAAVQSVCFPAPGTTGGDRTVLDPVAGTLPR